MIAMTARLFFITNHKISRSKLNRCMLNIKLRIKHINGIRMATAYSIWIACENRIRESCDSVPHQFLSVVKTSFENLYKRSV